MTQLFTTIDLGRMAYAPAYNLQGEYLDRVLAEREAAAVRTADSPHPGVGYVLLVEHDPPVITMTRRPAAASHLLATADALKREGIEVIETDRGGDITYHGPGQLVAYPILDLNVLKLRLHDYMRLLESAVIDTCGVFGVAGHRDACATGVWVGQGGTPACHGMEPVDAKPNDSKICAMGVRVRRWVSMHGLALNVTTNLAHFKHIVPCGLGRPVTSLSEQLGDRCPAMPLVKIELVRHLRLRLIQHLEAHDATQTFV